MPEEPGDRCPAARPMGGAEDQEVEEDASRVDRVGGDAQRMARAVSVILVGERRPRREQNSCCDGDSGNILSKASRGHGRGFLVWGTTGYGLGIGPFSPTVYAVFGRRVQLRRNPAPISSKPERLLDDPRPAVASGEQAPLPKNRGVVQRGTARLYTARGAGQPERAMRPVR